MLVAYMGKHVARMEEIRKAHKISIGHPEAKRPLKNSA
jgi:hypothetical protein